MSRRVLTSGIAAGRVRRASLFQTGLRVSGLLARARGGVQETLDSALRLLTPAQILLSVRAEVTIRSSDGKLSDRFFVGEDSNAEEVASSLARHSATLGPVTVNAEVRHSKDAIDVAIFVEFLAQQLAQWVALQQARVNKEALTAEIRRVQESLDLAKYVHRATSLIAGRHGLSEREAEEWLLGAAVHHQRPLLQVARDIVTALSTPSFGSGAAA